MIVFFQNISQLFSECVLSPATVHASQEITQFIHVDLQLYAKPMASTGTIEIHALADPGFPRQGREGCLS